MEILVILILAAMLWVGLRRNGPPAPQTMPDVAAEGARVGCGFPLAIMIVMAIAVLVIMSGLMVTGDCDMNAESGMSGNCLDKSFTIFEDTAGLHHYDSMEDWWNAPANPFK